MKRWVASLFVVLFCGIGLAGARADENEAAGGSLAIKVLSNRADLISGDDALVEIELPASVDASKVSVHLNGTEITGTFAVRPEGRYMGLVTGLRLGSNNLTARAPRAARATTTITNHPNGGPVFAGPQLQPWTCQDTAVDEQCNQPPTYRYFYRSTDPLTFELKPYGPGATDVAMTTTDEGVSVPFIVRVETGYQDRDQYKIATLFNPGQPWEPWAPQDQWNRKLLITHGYGCGVDYKAAGAPDLFTNGGIPVVGDLIGDFVSVPAGASPTVALGRGFAVMSTSLNHNGHNCNIALQAESLMMAKERVVEAYGPIRYTIGTGCSGGSVTSQQVANAYPGIYQGLVVSCAYPDTLTPGHQFADYHLLRLYFEHSERWGPGVVWNPAQMAAVDGHLTHLNAVIADEGLFKAAVSPVNRCGGISDQQRYHPVTNPSGVRCSILDAMINVLGPRPQSSWTPMEHAAGRGFAGAPIGNVGIQYGLDALQRGLITPAQFADLNAAIGGLDIDVNPTSERMAGDQPALRNAYRSGAINGATHLGGVAIITHIGPEPGAAHDARHAWEMRDRLRREQGHTDNHVIWFGAVPAIGDLNYFTEGLLAVDRWLSAVEADTTNRSLADKVAADRPTDIHDRCSQLQGLSGADGFFVPLAGALLDPVLGPLLNPLNQVVNPALDPVFNAVIDPALGQLCGPGPIGDLLQTRFGTPRTVAGGPQTADVLACTVRPVSRAEYGNLFNDQEWARLVEAFPNGVCDWSAPGIGAGDTMPWLTYQQTDGEVIYGGCPMRPRPMGSGGGWASDSFLAGAWTTAADDCGGIVDADPLVRDQRSVAAAGSDADAADAAVRVGPASAGQAVELPRTGGDSQTIVALLLAIVALAGWRLRRTPPPRTRDG